MPRVDCVRQAPGFPPERAWRWTEGGSGPRHHAPALAARREEGLPGAGVEVLALLDLGVRAGRDPDRQDQRIADLTVMKSLVRENSRPNFNVNFYAVDKKGRVGGAAIYPNGTFAVCDENGKRHEPLAALFERR